QRQFAAEMTPPAGEYGGEPSVSPDGRYVAFRGVDESGTVKLWIRPLDSIAARVFPGTGGAGHPFWSADSRALGFFTDQQLKTVDAAGGSPVALTSVTPTPWAEGGGTWNGQGTILFVPDTMNGLYKIAASGGKPVPVFKADAREFNQYSHPRFLPDGKHFLYLFFDNDPEKTGTYFASLDGRNQHLVIGGYESVVYSAGFLLYLREGTLVAQAFDADRGQF